MRPHRRECWFLFFVFSVNRLDCGQKDKFMETSKSWQNLLKTQLPNCGLYVLSPKICSPTARPWELIERRTGLAFDLDVGGSPLSGYLESMVVPKK